MTRASRNPGLERSWRERGLWLPESFASFFSATCQRLGDRTALVDGDRRLSFADLHRLSETLAGRLAGIGVARGTVVTVQLPNWWETVVVFHALMRIGAVLNPVLPMYRRRELEFILREAGSRVLVVPGTFRKFDHRVLAVELRGSVPSLETVIVVRDEPAAGMVSFETLLQPAGDAALPAPPGGDDLLLLMYTSGTTADPKGVLHPHRTLLYEVRSLERVHGFTDRDCVLMPSPLTHVSGLIHAVLAPAVLGTRAVVMDGWDADRGLERIVRESVTYMVGAPVFLSDLTHHPRLAERPPRTLRLFSCGGAGVSPELILESRKRLGCVSKRVYGSTEFPTLSTTGPDDPPERGASTEGRPIWAAEARVVDDDGRDVPTGREGEILARGPECFLGYKDPALDADAFTADGWFRTGDLGVVDTGGYLTVTGRKKDIVIRKGEKISAPEVEAVIARHPAVAEVAVVALPDPRTGERACACVIARPGQTLTLEDLVGFLRGQGLPNQKLPEALEILDEFPRTASGKVQKHLLRDKLERPA
jgi:cyclohexanecarboxylate-CoA ligase